MTNNDSNIALRFLYNTIPGRIILKPLVSPVFSKFTGLILNSRISKIIIPLFVKCNNINVEEYEKREYKSYNDFFTRKGVKGFRKIDMSCNSFVSPCDCSLSVHKIDDNMEYQIKNSKYKIKDLLKNEELAKEYSGGYIFISRLAVDNYHRYIFVDDCSIESTKYIKGILHTVQPIAFNSCNVFAENCREISVISTKNFGKIIQCEVGALIVGKINNYKFFLPVRRGTKKGMFEFGGSTIITLVKKNTVKIRKDIAVNSINGVETPVLLGEKIAQKF